MHDESSRGRKRNAPVASRPPLKKKAKTGDASWRAPLSNSADTESQPVSPSRPKSPPVSSTQRQSKHKDKARPPNQSNSTVGSFKLPRRTGESSRKRPALSSDPRDETPPPVHSLRRTSSGRVITSTAKVKAALSNATKRSELSKASLSKSSQGKRKERAVPVEVIELYSSSEEERQKCKHPPPKRRKTRTHVSEVIDLCSDDESAASSSKAPPVSRVENEAVVISSDLVNEFIVLHTTSPKLQEATSEQRNSESTIHVPSTLSDKKGVENVMAIASLDVVPRSQTDTVIRHSSLPVENIWSRSSYISESDMYETAMSSNLDKSYDEVRPSLGSILPAGLSSFSIDSVVNVNAYKDTSQKETFESSITEMKVNDASITSVEQANLQHSCPPSPITQLEAKVRCLLSEASSRTPESSNAAYAGLFSSTFSTSPVDPNNKYSLPEVQEPTRPNTPLFLPPLDAEDEDPFNVPSQSSSSSPKGNQALSTPKHTNSNQIQSHPPASLPTHANGHTDQHDSILQTPGTKLTTSTESRTIHSQDSLSKQPNISETQLDIEVGEVQGLDQTSLSANGAGEGLCFDGTMHAPEQPIQNPHTSRPINVERKTNTPHASLSQPSPPSRKSFDEICAEEMSRCFRESAGAQDTKKHGLSITYPTDPSTVLPRLHTPNFFTQSFIFPREPLRGISIVKQGVTSIVENDILPLITTQPREEAYTPPTISLGDFEKPLTRSVVPAFSVKEMSVTVPNTNDQNDIFSTHLVMEIPTEEQARGTTIETTLPPQEKGLHREVTGLQPTDVEDTSNDLPAVTQALETTGDLETCTPAQVQGGFSSDCDEELALPSLINDDITSQSRSFPPTPGLSRSYIALDAELFICSESPTAFNPDVFATILSMSVPVPFKEEEEGEEEEEEEEGEDLLSHFLGYPDENEIAR